MYRNPALLLSHIRVLSAVRSQAILDVLPRNARYCIIFSVKGARSVTDTMAGGDLDGDKYFVCFDETVRACFGQHGLVLCCAPLLGQFLDGSWRSVRAGAHGSSQTDRCAWLLPCAAAWLLGLMEYIRRVHLM